MPLRSRVRSPRAAATPDASRRPRAARAAAAAGPRINQWYHQYGEAGTQQAVEKYAAGYKDATVKVSWKPGDYDQSTAASLLTDAGPDVFEYGNGPTIDMIKGNQVVDLTDLIGRHEVRLQPEHPRADDLQRQDVCHPAGRRHAAARLPQVDARQGRRHAAQTIDELIAAAKKLTQGNVKGLFLGNDGGAGLMGGPMLWSAGLDYLTKDNQFGFDDPRAATALGKLREMWDAKVLLLGAPKDWFDASALTSGLTAMQFTGLWTFPDIKKGLGDDFGVMAWPALDGSGKASVPVGAYGSCVSAKSKDVEAAKKFAKWLWVDQTAGPARLRDGLRLPHPVPDEPHRPGVDPQGRAGRRGGQARDRRRPRPEPDALDPQVRHRLRRRDEPHRQGGRRPGRPRSPRSRPWPSPS